jgi:hypothetical protein
VIICPRCGKENQDHYKFCLGCGAELGPGPTSDGETEPPPVDRRGVPPTGRQEAIGGGEPMAPAAAAGAAMPDAPPPGTLVPCPNCGTDNPVGFTFCGNCGTRLKEDAPELDAAAPLAAAAAGEGGAAPVTPVTEPASSGEAIARLALIRPDGSEGGYHVLTEPDTILGRGSGSLFDNDSYLSPQHARLYLDGSNLILEDCGSLNGVFVRLTSDEPLYDSDVFRVGQELLRFDAIGEPALTVDETEILGSPNPGYWGRLSLIVRRGVDGSAFPLMGDEMVLGRERGDILFSDDGYVSGTHAKISITEEGEVYLTDLGSSNGTFIRLREARVVPFGTFILAGQQLFRLEAA